MSDSVNQDEVLTVQLAAPAQKLVAPMPRYNDARAQALTTFERGYLVQLMTAACGNVTRAAHLAGKERRALGKLLKKHGIDRAGFNAPLQH